MMRFNGRLFAIGIVSCGLLWVLVMVVYTKLERLDGDVTLQIRSDSIAVRMEELEKRVSVELQESNILLTKLKDQLDAQIQRRKELIRKQKHSGEMKGDKGHVLPVLVMACNRVTVQRCLNQLVNFRPNHTTFPIIVSQDCNHEPTQKAIQTYVDSHPGIHYVKQPDQSDIVLYGKNKKFGGYYRIARHYKFALTHVLDELGYESVIIVEDDLDISSDFFEYFLGTYPLLAKDPTLWCISAWNDNGKNGLIDAGAPALLHRTDFFPGLGWLLPAKHWQNLKTKWPPAFFDDWLREPEQTGGLSCIRPEISRTSTFGKEGVSKGMFFDLHLRYIQLNKQFVPFTKLNLTYLLKEEYDRRLAEALAAAAPLSADEVKRGDKPDAASALVTYSDKTTFKKVARTLGLMDDFRSGVARTVYRGVVTCFIKGRRTYIAPSTPFTGYDRTWS